MVDEESKKQMITQKIQYLSEETKSNDFLNSIVDKIKNIKATQVQYRITQIISLLIRSDIPYSLLKKYMFDGLPDDILSLRPLIWKISLGYLSLNTENWENDLSTNRNLYNTYKKKYMLDIIFFDLNKAKNEDPLSNKTKTDLWNNYFDDQELYQTIHKDVLRTRSNMNFVSMPSVTNKNSISSDIILKTAIDAKDQGNISNNLFLSKDFETNADVMNRILFIYAKLHPDVSYVQGMNELLAPIYYCFSNDNSPKFKNFVEEDSFITFEKLMNVIKDIFIRIKDNEPEGINTKFKNIISMLQMVDNELYCHLKNNNVKIEYYAFKWLTLFFTQDFEMPDVLRLWDSILSEPDIFEFLNLLVLAPLILKRKFLINESMAGILMILQNIEGITVLDLIQTGIKIRNILNNKCKF